MIQLPWLIALAIGTFGVIAVAVWGWYKRSRPDYGEKVLREVLEDVRKMNDEDYNKLCNEQDWDLQTK